MTSSRPTRVTFHENQGSTPTRPQIPVSSFSTLPSSNKPSSYETISSAESTEPVELAKKIFFESIRAVIPSTEEINPQVQVEGAAAAAKNCGLRPFIVTTNMFGEAADVGYNLGHLTESLAFCYQSKRSKQIDESILHSCVEAIKRIFKQYKWSTKEIIPGIFAEFDKSSKGLCFLFSGKLTLTATKKGKGGRNQELALSAGIKLDLSRNAPHIKSKVAILCAGTDGSDGPNDPAGGVVEDLTMHNAQKAGLSPVTFLKEHDQFHFFEQAAGGKYHVFIDDTGTDLADMVIIVILKTTPMKRV